MDGVSSRSADGLDVIDLLAHAPPRLQIGMGLRVRPREVFAVSCTVIDVHSDRSGHTRPVLVTSCSRMTMGMT